MNDIDNSIKKIFNNKNATSLQVYQKAQKLFKGSYAL